MFSGIVQCQVVVYCSAHVTAARTPCNIVALESTAPVFLINKNLPSVEEKIVS